MRILHELKDVLDSVHFNFQAKVVKCRILVVDELRRLEEKNGKKTGDSVQGKGEKVSKNPANGMDGKGSAS